MWHVHGWYQAEQNWSVSNSFTDPGKPYQCVFDPVLSKIERRRIDHLLFVSLAAHSCALRHIGRSFSSTCVSIIVPLAYQILLPVTTSNYYTAWVPP